MKWVWYGAAAARGMPDGAQKSNGRPEAPVAGNAVEVEGEPR